jgi:glycosyltransferase involved in cell wall biosynthesis
MRILILTFYYPPDLCAGSFRAKALVDALRAEGGQNLEIDVVTTLPNRYQSHLAEAPLFEEVDGLRIQRIGLPSHQSGFVDQAAAFAAFARHGSGRTKGQHWDVVVATSSRLMTAALGAHIANRMNAPLYLDVRDLFTDTMSDLLPGSLAATVLPVFRWLEARTFKAARAINVVSRGFLPHIRKIAPNGNFRTYTNGIDDEFLTENFAKNPGDGTELPLIVYAGNMGEGQGLHHVIPEAARLLQGKARLRLIGDGGKRVELAKAVSDAGVTNVEILDAVPRLELYAHYRAADILFMHLNDHSAFHKVLPSKLFEYGATSKPILAGVAGYPAEFLQTQLSGVAVFPPCDAQGMVAGIDQLVANPDVGDRQAFCEQYSRTAIMREMARDILAAGPK